MTGALVTIDAMVTQTKITQAVLDRGGDHLLTLMGNQSSLHNEIRRYLDDLAAKVRSRSETTGGDHGRIEVRRHWVGHDVDWLIIARRFRGEPRFPRLCAIAVFEAERNGRTCFKRRYHLSPMPLGATLFAHAVQCRRHVENCLHWVLDVVFHEDLSRLRPGAGPQNMATVRHLAMNLPRGAKDKHSLKVRRKSAAWDNAYLEALLRQSASMTFTRLPWGDVRPCSSCHQSSSGVPWACSGKAASTRAMSP